MLSRYYIKTGFAEKVVINIFKRKFANNIGSSFIVNSGFSDLVIPNVTVQEYLEPYYDKYEKFTAIECYETKRNYTYGQIRKKGTTLAKSLRKILKLNEADVVAILLPNVPEYPIANLGILKANLIVTTVSPAFTPDEISRQLIISDTKAIVTDVDLCATVKKALRISRKNIPILTVKTKNDQALPDETIDFHAFVNANLDYPDIVPCTPENIACIPFSSGTTGLPKGVDLTHRNLVSNLIQDNHPDMDYRTAATDDFREHVPLVLPLYHLFGYNIMMNACTIYGGKLTVLRQFSQNSYISMLREHQETTIMYLVPPLILMLISNETMKREYLRNLRVILSGAAPLAASDEERFLQKFGNHIYISQGYGLTETSPIVSRLHPKVLEDKSTYHGSVGKALPNTYLKIVDIEDPEDTPLGPNIKGELLVKGPQVMRGYHKNLEETKKAITQDGWLRTGDSSYYNKEGFFFIDDRYKELIKVKGNQVSPSELESVIRSFPGVSEVAVIGIPSETSGEVPRAYVVAKNKDKFDTKKLDGFVVEKVARYKALKGGIVLVDEIPKSQSGKMLKRKIKEEFFKSGK